MTKKSCIAVVTGGRPDYGLLRPLLRALAAEPAFDLKIIATGMHLIPEQGESLRAIEEDGFVVTEKVNLQITGDSPVEIASAIGTGVAGMAAMLERLLPDILILLGDRFEILSAAIAAMVTRVPVAHLYGGEATEGLIDEPIRHSITKMAQLHFTATEEYRRRVIQLGEQPERVHCVGTTGLDSVRTVDLLDRPALEQALDFNLGSPTFVVTYHSVTLEPESSAAHAEALLAALASFPRAQIVITLSNADTDSAPLHARLMEYVAANASRVSCYAALGTQRYLSLLSHCDVVIGNSSSGLIEAPSYHVPTVNIGDRQRGRIAPRSVIHCAPNADAIRKAIQTALHKDFRANLSNIINPYGDGRSAQRIIDILRDVPCPKDLIKKRFYNLPDIEK